MPILLQAALDETAEARLDRRNHAGVIVRRVPLSLELTSDDGGCRLSGPGPIVEAVALLDPEARLAPGVECRADEVLHADFDGDGSDDGLLRTIVDDRTVLLAILGGESPSAHVVSQVGDNDRPYLQTRAPSCRPVTLWATSSFRTTGYL